MRFDRKAAGQGVAVKCRLENGKAYLEWMIALVDEADSGEGKVSGVESKESAREERHGVREAGEGRRNPQYLRLRLVDNLGNVVAECVQDLREEELLESVLLKPFPWQGMKNPYLYGVEARIYDEGGECVDLLCKRLSLRQMELRPVASDTEKQLFLNGQGMELRAVRYSFPEINSAVQRQAYIYEDLQRIVELGANCVCVDEGEDWFVQLCERFGLLVGEYVVKENTAAESMPTENISAENTATESMSAENISAENTAAESMSAENIPAESTSTDENTSPETKAKMSVAIKFCGIPEDIKMSLKENPPFFRGRRNALFVCGNKNVSRPTSLCYKYLALWSSNPFVYIVPESIRRLESGNYKVTCYSNVKRIALYTEGNFFEFQNGEGEFVFWEVPAKGPCLILSAEGEGCATCFSVHKTFTKLSRIGDN